MTFVATDAGESSLDVSMVRNNGADEAGAFSRMIVQLFWYVASRGRSCIEIVCAVLVLYLPILLLTVIFVTFLCR